MINTDNYELYFFQYQEGLLDEKDRCEVESFLKSHPDLAEEFTLYAESPVLEPEDVSFVNKESLKHHAIIGWWRYAAAAVVVGAIGVSYILTRPNTQSIPEPLVSAIVNPISPNLPDEAIPVVENMGANVAKLSNVAPKSIFKALTPDAVNDIKIVDPVGETLPVVADEGLSEIITPAFITPSQDLAEIIADNPTQELPITIQPQETPIIVHDYSDTSLSDVLLEMAVDKYPEQTIQMASLSVKVGDFSKRVRNSNIVNIILSII